ncbi:hypothetical protein [Enterobacter cloacae]|uniref:hypothetical protein n=1 Tax=Enterobacter cloacae TaxID=550 RepID=UPI00101B1AFE|nr:hypothetical protein [Enterobacter cloacae]QBC01658.1 hypothetical protein EWI30_06030 [Enterobacter cloacae]
MATTMDHMVIFFITLIFSLDWRVMVSGVIHSIPDKSALSKYHVQTMHGLASHGPKKNPQSAGLEYFIVC